MNGQNPVSIEISGKSAQFHITCWRGDRQSIHRCEPCGCPSSLDSPGPQGMMERMVQRQRQRRLRYLLTESALWALAVPAFPRPSPGLPKNRAAEVRQENRPWASLGPPAPPSPVSTEGEMLCRVRDIRPPWVVRQQGWGPSERPLLVWLLSLFSVPQGTVQPKGRVLETVSQI